MSRDFLDERIARLKRESSRPGNRRADQVAEMHDIWADLHFDLSRSDDERDRLKARFLTIDRRHVPLRGLQ